MGALCGHHDKVGCKGSRVRVNTEKELTEFRHGHQISLSPDASLHGSGHTCDGVNTIKDAADHPAVVARTVMMRLTSGRVRHASLGILEANETATLDRNFVTSRNPLRICLAVPQLSQT